MPRVDHILSGEAPKEPHMAIMTDAAGLWTAIPPGAIMAIIENPKHASGIFPLVLLSVNHKKMLFRCGCGTAGCTRRVEFKARWVGVHLEAPKARVD